MRLKFLGQNIHRITLESTDLCNLDCRFCFLKKSRKINSHHNNKYNHLSYRLFEKLIKQLSKFDNYQEIAVNLSGGEPFLNPRIFKMLEFSRDYGIRLIIFTNGTCLNKKQIFRILDNQVSSLMFSVDGSLGEHDANRGKGNFNKTIETIKVLRNAKKTLTLDTPKITVNTVINKLNLGSFDEMVYLAKEIGSNMINFSLVQWSDDYIIDKSIEELSARFGNCYKATGMIKSINHGLGKLTQKEIKKVIDKINFIKNNLSSFSPLNISFFPDFSTKEEFKKWFSTGCYKIDYCSNIFEQIRIDCHGNVFSGCSIPFYKLGNIKNEQLSDVLNSRRARKLNLSIKKNGFFYICQRCCRRPSNSKILKKQ